MWRHYLVLSGITIWRYLALSGAIRRNPGRYLALSGTIRHRYLVSISGSAIWRYLVPLSGVIRRYPALSGAIRCYPALSDVAIQRYPMVLYGAISSTIWRYPALSGAIRHRYPTLSDAIRHYLALAIRRYPAALSGAAPARDAALQTKDGRMEDLFTRHPPHQRFRRISPHKGERGRTRRTRANQGGPGRTRVNEGDSIKRILRNLWNLRQSQLSGTLWHYPASLSHAIWYYPALSGAIRVPIRRYPALSSIAIRRHYLALSGAIWQRYVAALSGAIRHHYLALSGAIRRYPAQSGSLSGAIRHYPASLSGVNIWHYLVLSGGAIWRCYLALSGATIWCYPALSGAIRPYLTSLSSAIQWCYMVLSGAIRHYPALSGVIRHYLGLSGIAIRRYLMLSGAIRHYLALAIRRYPAALSGAAPTRDAALRTKDGRMEDLFTRHLPHRRFRRISPHKGKRGRTRANEGERG
jgi:hypothetical protein